MRYVDEYRAPEQVMQLVAHLQQRARLLPHTAARPLRIMEVCGGHTHAILNSGSTNCCRRTSNLFMVPAVRCASCRWGASTPALRLPAARGDLLHLRRRHARAG